jgi:hypothetical protein
MAQFVGSGEFHMPLGQAGAQALRKGANRFMRAGNRGQIA